MRISVIDDDPIFLNQVARFAKTRGIETNLILNFEEANIEKLRDSDLIIIDYYLGSVTGNVLIDYFDYFSFERPIVMVSSKDKPNMTETLTPGNIYFVTKKHGAFHIVAKSEEIYRNLSRLTAC